jgi:anti-anti-sigma factor
MKNDNCAPAQPVSLSACSQDLDLHLEAHGPGVLVLYCESKMIFQSEARTLVDIVTEVLPAACRMVVDLSGVQAIDNAGLGELVMTQMWADASGFDLKFASPKPSVLQLFETTNLISVFSLYATVPEAMSAMPYQEVRLT